MTTFNLNKEDIKERFGADCEFFLDKGYMSDEEVAEVNARGQTLSFTKLVPKWRSDTVSNRIKLNNSFFFNMTYLFFF